MAKNDQPKISRHVLLAQSLNKYRSEAFMREKFDKDWRKRSSAMLFQKKLLDLPL